MTIFTKAHGVVRGISHKQKTLDKGMIVSITYKARLVEQLGMLDIEIINNPIINYFNTPKALNQVVSMLALLNEALPLMHAYSEFYDYIHAFIHNVCDMNYYVFFEVELLRVMGFELVLNECAVTGVKEDLAYVSPKTGRAVCKAVGAPYHDKIFVLPTFLTQLSINPTTKEIAQALNITGHFLNQQLRYLPKERIHILA